MGESKRRKLLDPNYGKIGAKPRGFYESPTDEAIERYLSDPELHAWIKKLTSWSTLRVWQLLKSLAVEVKRDKEHDTRMFDTQAKITTIGMNTATWVLWVQPPIPDNAIAFGLIAGIVTMDDVCPDWSKSAFDFELK